MKNVIRFGIVTMVVIVAVFILIALPSHVDCGKIGYDYIPCDYAGRVNWELQNGVWMTLLFIGLVLNIGNAFYDKSKNTKKSER